MDTQTIKEPSPPSKNTIHQYLAYKGASNVPVPNWPVILHSYGLTSVVGLNFPPNLCNRKILKEHHKSWHMMVALCGSLKAWFWLKKKDTQCDIIAETCGVILACKNHSKAKCLEKVKVCNSYHVSICLGKIRMVFTWFQRNSSQNLSKKRCHRWFSTTPLALSTLMTARILSMPMSLATHCARWTHLILEYM